MTSQIATAAGIGLIGIAVTACQPEDNNYPLSPTARTGSTTDTRAPVQEERSAVMQSDTVVASPGEPADRNPLADMAIDQIVGMSVVNYHGEKVGDVDQVWLHLSNDQKVAVIDLQEVMNGNAREVAVPLHNLSLAPDGKQLRTSYTKEQLQTLPDFDESEYGDIEEISS